MPSQRSCCWVLIAGAPEFPAELALATHDQPCLLEMQATHACDCMQVAAERAAAWHFIIDMEVEAPARFQVCLHPTF